MIEFIPAWFLKHVCQDKLDVTNAWELYKIILEADHRRTEARQKLNTKFNYENW